MIEISYRKSLTVRHFTAGPPRYISGDAPDACSLGSFRPNPEGKRFKTVLDAAYGTPPGSGRFRQTGYRADEFRADL